MKCSEKHKASIVLHKIRLPSVGGGYKVSSARSIDNQEKQRNRHVNKHLPQEYLTTPSGTYFLAMDHTS